LPPLVFLNDLNALLPMRTPLPLLANFVAIVCVSMAVTGCSSKARKARLEESAKKYFDAGEFEKAKIECLNVIKLDPKDAAALSRLAMIWTEQGSPVQALPYFVEARKLAPDDLALRTKMMSTLVTLAAGKEARAEATAILQKAPDNGEALIALAETSGTREDIASTREEIRKFPGRESAAAHIAEATLLIRENDAASARDAIEKALAADPKSVKALTMSAGLILKQGDREEGLRRLKTATELSPIRSSYRLKHAEFTAATPGPAAAEEANRMVAEVIRQAPDYLPALTLSARLSFAAKKHAEGMATLDKVFAVDRANLPARLLQASGWLAAGDAVKAVAGLEELSKAYPRLPMVKLQLAAACVQNADLTKAANVLNELLKQEPELTDARFMLAQVNFRSGRPDLVISDMAELLKKPSAPARAAHFLAAAHKASGKPNDAVAVLEELVAREPKDPGHQFYLAEMLRDAGRPGDARSTLERIQSMVPENVAVVSQLVDLDLLENKAPDALSKIDEYLGKKPDSAAAHFVKAKVYVFQKASKDAEVELEKAISLNPSYWEAYRMLAAVYGETKRTPEAIAKLEAVLSKNPGDLRSLRQAAFLYEAQGDFVKASAAYEKLLAAPGEPDPMILNNQAYLFLARLNKPDEALALAQRARGLRPGTDLAAEPAQKTEAAAVADTLGWALFRKGEYHEALALAREAAGFFGNNPEIQFHLGMAAYMMDQKDEAKAALKLAAEGAADFPGKEEARAKLALLGGAGSSATVMTREELKAMIAKQPGDLVLLTRLGEACEREKDFPAAREAYEQVLKGNPKLIPVAVKLAQLLAGPLQNPGKAREVAEKAREAAPADPHAAGILGEVLLRTGEIRKAYDLLRESDHALKKDARVLLNLGWASYSLGNVPEARDAMQRLLAAAPQSAEAVGARSFLELTNSTDPANATAIARSAEDLLKSDPRHVPALMVRAAAHSRNAKDTEAAAIYQEILARFPDFAPAQKQLAALYCEDPQNRDKGYALAVKARESLGDDPELSRTLAILSYHRKNFAYAIELLEESARNAPLDARGLFYSGMARFHTKDRPGSKTALDAALAAGLPEPMASEAKRTLAGLATR
jgi:tetratricopeptide (TPR) repeat protein